jgi:magnesium transporter
MPSIKLRRKAHTRRKKTSKPGTPPGHLTHDPTAPRSRVEAISYGPDDFVELEVTDLAELRELRGKRPLLWVNVNGLGDVATLSALGELFGLHPLALEDVVHVPQRPKVEAFAEVLFVVLQMTTVASAPAAEQVSLFIGDDFVVTFQEHDGDCLDPVRERIRRGGGRIRDSGADYLGYALVDAIVDQYFPVLDAFVDRMEALEDRVVAARSTDVHTALYELRQEGRALRRVIWPLRDALGTLAREHHPRINEETRLYFRDCHDHAFQLIEIVESARETANGLMDLHLSISSQRMNEVMKVLTIIATIFIPLSWVAGVYGMNFDREASPWNMPELHSALGYPMVLGFMALVAGGMLYYFRRKGWLGGDGPEPRESGPDQP